MFEGREILCLGNKPAELVCINPNCNSGLFVCSKTCDCFTGHERQCILKNIRQLSNGLETVLKRNFCKVFKGEGIEVIGRVARQTLKTPRNFRFCFTQCKVDPKRDMEFMIRTLKCCVGVGILHKPTIIKNQYQYLPDQDYINHGAFMILSNGYQYSHNQMGENFIQYKNIRMEEGKKIKIRVSGEKAIFEQDCLTVALSLPEGLSDLYYGVYLYEQGDEIQVLVKK